MLSVAMTSMPISSRSSTSSHRFSWRLAGGVRVGELVDEHDIGSPRDHAIEVHLLDGRAAVLDAAAGHDLEVADLGGRVLAAVGLDHADDDVGARDRDADIPR